MPEQQNIEYKQSWHDDYLKWVCGFANAQGGVIFIGKDDNGNVVGITDYKRLMDDIPNKIRNSIGIMVEVNLHEEEGMRFIEIVTHPYTVPISLRGRYYYRCGSTKQELTGASLNEFLLKKSGKTWDDVVESRASFDDIDEKTVSIFLKASENAGRLPENESLALPDLFEKLRLTENGQLKRSALVIFGKDPGKFYPNTFVKIGRFGKDDADIKFQETEEGNIIQLLQAVLHQLNQKFLTRTIEFEGMHRIEKGEYPIAAIREMLLNALVHRNFMGSSIQIRVYDDKISIWNEGSLPAGLTLDALKRSHSSRPRNPIIADVCFKGGYIDAWGRGTIKIIDTCKQAELPEPEMKELDGGFIITLFKDNLTSEQLTKLGLNGRQIKAVLFVKEKGKITNSEYQILNEISDRTALRDIDELTQKGILIKEGEKKGTYYKLDVGG
ncbi:MAG: transcriptional regulator [Clostridia bacterium]|nr:transcriptional regulator [Clostridia bacterium]